MKIIFKMAKQNQFLVSVVLRIFFHLYHVVPCSMTMSTQHHVTYRLEAASGRWVARGCRR